MGVAKLLIGVPTLPGMGTTQAADVPPWKATLTCTQIAIDRTKSLKALQDDRDSKSKARDGAVADLAGYNADYLGDTDQPDSVKQGRKTKAEDVRKKTKAAAEAVTAYGKAKDLLTFRSRSNFPADAASFALLEATPADVGGKLADMLKIELSNGAAGVATEIWVICPNLQVRPTAADCGKDASGFPLGKMTTAQEEIDKLLTKAAVARDFRPIRRRTTISGLTSASQCNADTKSPCGVLYRVPTPARLQLCKLTEASDCGGLLPGNANIVLREERNAPQLGGVRSLPLRNDMFEGNSLVAAFAPDGMPVSMTYAKTGAELPGLLGAAGEVVTGASEIDAYNRARGLRETQNATTIANAQTALDLARRKEMDAERERIEAQAKLDALVDATTGNMP
ncbi:hypothetical protein D1610_06755 [Sphingomonas gilva]|uniref:Uncharacterized protein n=1 Tax=Sphingomonas gilva TaxID=2305907 RepID=A0A396RP16_9SPHN|nr:hypothetical protein D1610_06755 [Sphingomonas gilva]